MRTPALLASQTGGRFVVLTVVLKVGSRSFFEGFISLRSHETNSSYGGSGAWWRRRGFGAYLLGYVHVVQA
jgi:hypothetical protein